MLLRNFQPAPGQPLRSKLDAAVVASILAMSALGILAVTDLIGPAKAYAAAPCTCTIAGIALA